MCYYLETCAITHSTIRKVDPVTMVVLAEAGLRASWWANPEHSWFCVESVHRNVVYDGYSWADGVKFEEAEARPVRRRSIFFHQGVWDAILAMLPSKQEKWQLERVDLLRKLEADQRKQVAETQGPEVAKAVEASGYLEPRQLPDDLVRVGLFACSCRINLNAGLAYKGWEWEDDVRYGQLHDLMAERAKVMQLWANTRNNQWAAGTKPAQ